MSSQSLALASLTATYTDSEGEEDGVEEDNEKSPNDDSSVNSNTSNIATPPVPTIPPRLVSYHDDTVLSDDEGVPGEGSEQERLKASGNEGEGPDGVRLPPEPTGLCSNLLQEKITRLHERMESNGLDMNHVIQQRKDFRNPSIYEKLIQFCSINEFGTNYPAQAYDPLRWGKESFYEELARVQKAEMDRREKERKDKTKVEFVSGTAKRPGSGSGAEDDAKRRKSKWDQVGTMVAANMTGNTQTGHIMKPAGLLQQPSLTTSVTGTKGTVISAFGSLPKKPRI
ncbi:SAP30-binding protein isoform X1 [Periplaneta americana]|uniref:SAP30-binding protein isoform X1 n=1 Tax=Periplaneta americana TaxID=6978 RepID=UPI0037E793E3